MLAVLLPLITLVFGFVTSFALELVRNRLTRRNVQDVRIADRKQAEYLDRVAFERDGLRAIHAAIHDLLNAVNAISTAQGKAEATGADWRETAEGSALRGEAMHANVNCSHESALLLHQPVIDAVERLTAAAYPMYWTRESGADADHRQAFYGAIADATKAVAHRLRELYGFTSSDN